uniref:ATP-dependent RNA helicase SUPV3L1, mitochondrial isoform X2 n=1 Tax=Myxine glutinosa TaxID=7769 RepID=UPI00358EB142
MLRRVPQRWPVRYLWRTVTRPRQQVVPAGCMNLSQGEDPGTGADTSLFVPLKVKPDNDSRNIGAELSGSLNRNKVLSVLNTFYKRKQIQKLAGSNGLDARLFHKAFISFRKWVMESKTLPADFHVILNDICLQAGHVDDIFPYFMQHAKQIFPMLDCMEDLRKVSDLRHPANWYQDARKIHRKIVFHSGPTNSGKTYHAIQRFLEAKSAVYCGPLKLLAHEIFEQSNNNGIACDLVTGEERCFGNPEGHVSPHTACTVEMCNINQPCEVAVIDEIQMIRDWARGWAWTRALLGVCAEEVHVCGEAAAINLVTELMITTGEEVEVLKYDRLSPIKLLNEPVETLDHLRPGDCIVCFNKNDIYSISRQIESKGMECAVIYGSLPPGAKLSQAKKFNDPEDPCKILVATDAIGMGLNLSIRRMIFNSITKPFVNEKGEKEVDYISTSQALQIAGRAGRFSSAFIHGEVTTMYRHDLLPLQEILSKPVKEIEDIFVNLAQVDGRFFVCNVDDFKFLAEMIQHIPLNLRVRYVFCTAPINRKQPFLCTSFLKFARQYSRNEPLTYSWLCRLVGWPVSSPHNIRDLAHLEAVHDVCDLYLWFSYRFPDMFIDPEPVRIIQKRLDEIVQEGVKRITCLIHAMDTSTSPQILGTMELVTLQGKKAMEKQLVTRKTDAPRKNSSSQDRPECDTTISQKLPSSLTEQLVAKGLLTPAMLKQLQKEWMGIKETSGINLAPYKDHTVAGNPQPKNWSNKETERNIRKGTEWDSNEWERVTDERRDLPNVDEEGKRDTKPTDDAEVEDEWRKEDAEVEDEWRKEDAEVEDEGRKEDAEVEDERRKKDAEVEDEQRKEDADVEDERRKEDADVEDEWRKEDAEVEDEWRKEDAEVEDEWRKEDAECTYSQPSGQ